MNNPPDFVHLAIRQNSFEDGLSVSSVKTGIAVA